MGIVLTARARRNMLAEIADTTRIDGHSRVNPCVCLRAITHTTSSTPASSRYIQDIAFSRVVLSSPGTAHLVRNSNGAAVHVKHFKPSCQNGSIAWREHVALRSAGEETPVLRAGGRMDFKTGVRSPQPLFFYVPVESNSSLLVDRASSAGNLSRPGGRLVRWA
jgi:hypothetical protein